MHLSGNCGGGGGEGRAAGTGTAVPQSASDRQAANIVTAPCATAGVCVCVCPHLTRLEDTTALICAFVVVLACNEEYLRVDEISVLSNV